MDSKKISGVYKITNTVTGMCYIGSSVNIKARLGAHIHLLRNKKHTNNHMQSSFDKYGKESFEFEIIFKCAPVKSEMLFYEQLWIDLYGLDSLYNQRPFATSNLGTKRTKDSKIRQSRVKGVNAIFKVDINGSVIDKYDTITEAAESNGVDMRHMSRSIRDSCFCKGHLYVKNLSKIPGALKKREEMLAAKSRSVHQIDVDSGEIIRTYPSLCCAGRYLNTDDSSIGKVCRGLKKTCKGYVWRYADEYS